MTTLTTDRRLGLNGGAAIKVPCRAATTANITLSGEQTVDGVACVTGDRVLVKNQTDQTTNGVYDVSTAAWTRSYDYNGNFDVVTGTIVMVISGTTNINTYWRLSTTGTITIGTSNLTYEYALAGDAAMVSFIQSGTGAVARLVQDKLRERVTATDYGAVADFGTTSAATNNTAIQKALDSFGANGGVLIIPKGVKWGPYTSLTFPDEVEVRDESGWDWIYNQWTAQIKWLLKTSSPGTKNANEIQIIAPWHPALVLDNVNPAANPTDNLATVVYRRNGAGTWQHGQSVGSSDLDFHLDEVQGGTVSVAMHVTRYNSPTHGPNRWGFTGQALPGVAYTFFDPNDETFVTRHTALLANECQFQYANASNGVRSTWRHRDDGTVSLIQLGNEGFVLGPSAELAARKFVAPYSGADHTVTVNESGYIFTNTGAAATRVFSLPAATVGKTYEFIVTAAFNLDIYPQTGETIRGGTASNQTRSSTVGSVCRLICAVAGTWDVEILRGTWTQF